MSSLPHDASDTAAADRPMPLISGVPRYEQQVDEAVSEFESGAEWLGVPRPSTSELRDLCRQVAAFTAGMFPAGMAIKVKNDPECTDDIYFVFDVVDSGGVDEMVARDNEWHRRLRGEVGRQAELFCLSIDAR